MMSTYLALPWRRHLEQLYDMFGYLKANPKRKLYLDHQHPQVDERSFQSYDWYDFYRYALEAVPGDMSPPRGESVSTHCFVDSDHAGIRVTRRSQTGLLLFVNRAPIVWYSKHQNTVETSTFGSEFITMKTAVEEIEALRYKLRMFGVPLEGPTSIFCDNELVFKNSSIPDSTLKKKHTSICYHRSREAVAAGTIQIAKVGTTTNLSDLFTKPLPEPRHMFLLNRFTYWENREWVFTHAGFPTPSHGGNGRFWTRQGVSQFTKYRDTSQGDQMNCNARWFQYLNMSPK